MENKANYSELMIIDGLNVSKWYRPVFEAMHKGGVTAANCTCCIWEDFPATMKAVADWKQWIQKNSDILTQVYSIKDIWRAKKENKVGIILGWQNTTGFGDYLPLVQVYKELGLGIVQLAYNTANTVGCGCYEKNDGGLTDFGRALVDEMNRVGILIDLSHVGPKTSRDAIEYSQKPVAYSHCLPAALKNHSRNKSDEDLKFIADNGGFVGVTMFPPFLKNGAKSTAQDYIEAIEYVIDLVGEDHVGIGTDFTQDQDDSFFSYITHDKGYGRSLTEFGDIINPKGFRQIDDFPNLVMQMEHRGWKQNRIEKIMGENWISFLELVWGD
jgi:membrane dipeptidase